MYSRVGVQEGEGNESEKRKRRAFIGSWVAVKKEAVGGVDGCHGR